MTTEGELSVPQHRRKTFKQGSFTNNDDCLWDHFSSQQHKQQGGGKGNLVSIQAAIIAQKTLTTKAWNVTKAAKQSWIFILCSFIRINPTQVQHQPLPVLLHIWLHSHYRCYSASVLFIILLVTIRLVHLIIVILIRGPTPAVTASTSSH